jgi:LacI family transcriptional regulator
VSQRTAAPNGPGRRQNERVTILDVANAAGVKPSTVSKALNDGRGSAEVRRRIDEAVSRLGYRPNQQARGLRRSESRSIGVLIPDLANPVFLPFLRGVEHAAQERGYVVLITDGQRSHDPATTGLGRFFDQGVDGLVLGGPVPPESLQLYIDHGVPTAPSLTDGGRDLARHWGQGESDATAEMARRLLDLGHRRFSFVTTPPPPGQEGRRYGAGRLGPLVAAIKEREAELSISLIDPVAGFEACRSDLVKAVVETSPTALVCSNHVLAPWLLMAIDRAGLTVPDDVSLVLYGDSDWARAHRPALSVIRRDAYAEGYDLTASMLDEIAGLDAPRRGVIDARFVDRDSCAAPAHGGAQGHTGSVLGGRIPE